MGWWHHALWRFPFRAVQCLMMYLKQVLRKPERIRFNKQPQNITKLNVRGVCVHLGYVCAHTPVCVHASGWPMNPRDVLSPPFWWRACRAPTVDMGAGDPESDPPACTALCQQCSLQPCRACFLLVALILLVLPVCVCVFFSCLFTDQLLTDHSTHLQCLAHQVSTVDSNQWPFRLAQPLLLSQKSMYHLCSNFISCILLLQWLHERNKGVGKVRKALYELSCIYSAECAKLLRIHWKQIYWESSNPCWFSWQNHAVFCSLTVCVELMIFVYMAFMVV